jgi:hypothetical protein
MPGSDRRTDPEWPIRPEPRADTAEPTTERRRGDSNRTIVKARRGVVSPAIIALGALVVLLLVVWLLTTSRNPDQDKLTGAETARTAAADPEKLCASQSTYDLIKRDLFREAAQLKGSDLPAFDKLASYAVLRVQNPVMESQDKGTGAINCSGSLSLDLPPGVATVGGQRTLTSDADYTIQPAADGSGNVVLVHNVDAIISPLATLGRTEPAATPINGAPLDQGVVPPTPGTPPLIQPAPGSQAALPTGVAPPQPRAATPQPQPPATASAAHPSFNCANARSSGEVAVCRSSSLAGLDRQMAAEYGQAFAVATPAQRALLRSTAHRFYAYRDRCPDRQCIAAAYTDRVREIRDIVSDRWTPPG